MTCALAGFFGGIAGGLVLGVWYFIAKTDVGLPPVNPPAQ